jgi:hypothetical protein
MESAASTEAPSVKKPGVEPDFFTLGVELAAGRT